MVVVVVVKIGVWLTKSGEEGKRERERVGEMRVKPRERRGGVARRREASLEPGCMSACSYIHDQ